jgi:antitoxin component of RelBE/YafQ-DinJ toxin-antitoxin module
MFRSTKNRV